MFYIELNHPYQMPRAFDPPSFSKRARRGTQASFEKGGGVKRWKIFIHKELKFYWILFLNFLFSFPA